jgi:hypothetical protein
MEPEVVGVQSRAKSKAVLATCATIGVIEKEDLK